MLVIDMRGWQSCIGWVETMEANSKTAEFEAEAIARLARIRAGGKTLKPGLIKKLVRGKVSYKGASNRK